MELVTCDATQLGEHGLAVWADVDVGIGRIESDGLVRIEDERPCAGSMFDGVERVGPLQRRDAGLGIESERYIAVTRRRAQRAR